MGTKGALSRFDALVIMFCAGCATSLTAYALHLGYDGVLLLATLSGLNGAGAFFFGKSYKAQPRNPPS